MNRNFYNIIYFLLITIQLLLLKCYVTLSSNLIAILYIIVFIVIIYFLKIIYDSKKQSRKKVFIYSSVAIALLICLLLTKTSSIPAAKLVDKKFDKNYYIIFQERNSPDYIRLYCDKLTFDLVNVSDDYINIEYTVFPLSKKYYFKSLDIIDN